MPQMALDKAKYKSVILYLANKLGGEVRGKKKLAKLLYFVDFDFFEKYEKPITGDVYGALPMGPFPRSLDKIVAALVRDHSIEVNSIEDRPGLLPTEVYSAKERPDVSVFDRKEIEILDRVVSKYGHLNGKQLEDLTHAEAPYIGTDLNKDIAYELSFYRGTDFVESND